MLTPPFSNSTLKKPKRALFLRNESGASAVEFAVVFPLFLLITLVILAYGIYFGAAHSIQQLAADAARSSVPGLNAAERMQLSQSYVSAMPAATRLLRRIKSPSQRCLAQAIPTI